ncbi:MAG TPA: glycosyltransferase family 1 protein, partial [Chthonomonadaceae bacterium]|nr:glycosyltransferase family 1 protein [Chthonomonadaceae bacterium]
MRIAIDGRALTGRFTGDRTYWRNLLRALLRMDTENEYLIYSRAPIPPGEILYAPNAVCRVLEASNERAWSFLALPRALKADHADLAHVQYTVPPRCPCPVVTTVHDISFRLYPQWFPFKHRTLLNLTVPPSMRRAARVITDSESSRKDMLRVYGLPPEKIVAIPLGLPEGFGPISHPPASDLPPGPLPKGKGSETSTSTLIPGPSPSEGEGSQTETPAHLPPLPSEGRATGEGDGGWESSQETARRIAKERFGREKPFILAVGVLQPRKNLGLLAEAFGKAKAKHHLPHELVCVGKAGWGTEQEALRALAARRGGAEAAEAVVFPGYVEDADLPILYQACAVFAYPS